MLTDIHLEHYLRVELRWKRHFTLKDVEKVATEMEKS